jgi:hypothetical protein
MCMFVSLSLSLSRSLSLSLSLERSLSLSLARSLSLNSQLSIDNSQGTPPPPHLTTALKAPSRRVTPRHTLHSQKLIAHSRSLRQIHGWLLCCASLAYVSLVNYRLNEYGTCFRTVRCRAPPSATLPSICFICCCHVQKSSSIVEVQWRGARTSSKAHVPMQGPFQRGPHLALACKACCCRCCCRCWKVVQSFPCFELL